MNCEEFNKAMEPLKLAHKIAMENLRVRRMNILYESMTRIPWGDGVIRIWREWECPWVAGSNEDLHAVVRSANPATDDVLKLLLEMERVNAVEVVDGSGCGTVAYKDWP